MQKLTSILIDEDKTSDRSQTDIVSEDHECLLMSIASCRHACSAQHAPKERSCWHVDRMFTLRSAAMFREAAS